jgi:hypothetical protein
MFYEPPSSRSTHPGSRALLSRPAAALLFVERVIVPQPELVRRRAELRAREALWQERNRRRAAGGMAGKEPSNGGERAIDPPAPAAGAFASRYPKSVLAPRMNESGRTGS